MNRFYLILGLFLPFFAISQSESTQATYDYKATYNLTYQIDSTDVNSIDSEEMVLLSGERYSAFMSWVTFKKDSIRAARMKAFKRTKQMSSGPTTEFDYKIIKDKPAGQIYFLDKVLRDKYKIEENLGQMKWNIEPETKKILDYTAQKATTRFAGRDYTAWFTTEIPIADGPYKFSGLPGFILEIEDTQQYYHFKLIGFERLNEQLQKELDLESYQSLTVEQFKKARANYNRDPISAAERVGITMGLTPEQRKQMIREHREEIKKKNNPIELK